jgi:hypothetical protein
MIIERGALDPRITAKAMREKLPQWLIAKGEPTPLRHAIGDICELLGPQLRKVFEHCLPNDVGVYLSDAIDRMRRNHAKICHAHQLLSCNVRTPMSVRAYALLGTI